MGRDIIGICEGDERLWDNYQCKHYCHPLTPVDVWSELGKLAYHTKRGAFSYPRNYFFVAPQGAGTKLSNLLRRPNDLRRQLCANWAKYCCTQITSTASVPLDNELTTYIDSLDFTIFKAIPPLRLLEQHAKTRWHVYRFGGGLPPRPSVPAPPRDPAKVEAIYVRHLLDAYGDYLKRDLSAITDITDETDLHDHFADSRREFYSAEALRAFSRDTLPPGEFERLQDELHSGIRDELRADHADGYRRVVAVVKVARYLQLTAHALISRLSLRDRGGICHQLANDNKLRWVK
jgi:hypothetical protein